ncbi:MAG: thiamine phosphate synthase [Bacteroides sp.]|nr:thiamine phosphate synthase [Bacteroides sp.]MBD5277612.1 thiamine phosphate synthase [Bacteroides sp.]MDE6043415.1 thiamine phosphate synthase [Muribaculaceae bacterium]
MLQFIASVNDKYSVAELAQMAIEGGCHWVELDLPGASDDFVRSTTLELKDLCLETGTFLTIVDRPEVARETGLHGVQLRGARAAEAAAVREQLGAEAIIGIEVTRAEDILKVQNLDIDYATLPAGLTVAQVEAIVKTVREAEVNLPIVARGEFTPDEAIEMMVAGASGVAVGSSIADAPDPVEAVTLLIEALQAAK